jgi:AcrR family transcriptional regulator
MSWFEACEYGPFERAKGMRFPPRMAARRVFTGTTVSATLCLVKKPVSRVTEAVSDALEAIAPRIDGRASRWTQHRIARREELIDAAVAAVNRHGSEVGMDQIAAVARTSKPVIYRYFTDKNDLYRAVGDRVIAQIVSVLRRVELDADPQALLRASIDAYLQLLEENPQLFRFVTQNRLLNEARPGEPTAADFSRPVAEVLTAALGEQLRSIGLDPAGARPWGEAAVGFIRAASLWWLDNPGTMTRPELREYLAALLWGGGAGVFQLAGREVDARPHPGVFAKLPR